MPRNVQSRAIINVLRAGSSEPGHFPRADSGNLTVSICSLDLELPLAARHSESLHECDETWPENSLFEA